MKNKKADIAITLLVFMTLLLVGASLFIFITKSKPIRETILNSRIIEVVYLSEEKVMFYMTDAGEKAVQNGNFNREIFKQEIAKYNFDDENLKKFQQYIAEDKFEVINEGNLIKIKLNEFSISKPLVNKVGIVYKPSIEVEIIAIEITSV